MRGNSRERSERSANNVDDGSTEDRNMTEDSENPVE
jgi:hypothetical protein